MAYITLGLWIALIIYIIVFVQIFFNRTMDSIVEYIGKSTILTDLIEIIKEGKEEVLKDIQEGNKKGLITTHLIIGGLYVALGITWGMIILVPIAFIIILYPLVIIAAIVAFIGFRKNLKIFKKKK